MARGSSIWFLACLIFGLYFINQGLKFVDLSKIIPDSIGMWISVIGGALIIIGGVMSLTRNRYRLRGRY